MRYDIHICHYAAKGYIPFNCFEITQNISFGPSTLVFDLILLDILCSALKVLSAQTHCIQPSAHIPTYYAERCLRAAEAPRSGNHHRLSYSNIQAKRP